MDSPDGSSRPRREEGAARRGLSSVGPRRFPSGDRAGRPSRLDEDRWLTQIVLFFVVATIAVLGLIAGALLLLASAGSDPPAL